MPKGAICCHQGQTLTLRLCNQHTIERIRMMWRQGPCCLRMSYTDGNGTAPGRYRNFTQVIRCVQLPEGALDGNLPDADGTDVKFGILTFDRPSVCG